MLLLFNVWLCACVQGVVNGPTDGQILCMIFCSTAAAFPGIWSQPMGAQLPGIFAGTR